MEIDGFGTLIHADDLEWVEVPGGNALKVMRVSQETGSWTALFRSAKGTTPPENVEMAGLYWHFVDLVWVFVFTLFYLL